MYTKLMKTDNIYMIFIFSNIKLYTKIEFKENVVATRLAIMQ